MSSRAVAAERVRQTLYRWLESFVVGLNLCPFAKPLLRADNLRITVCSESDARGRSHALLHELNELQGSSEEQIATTLLVFTAGLDEFEQFLDFVATAQELLVSAGLEGLIQLASFHPRYQFAGEPAEAASHFSNRAPYPVIHLLRESMLTRVLDAYDQPELIPENNIHTLNSLGSEVLRARYTQLFD